MGFSLRIYAANCRSLYTVGAAVDHHWRCHRTAQPCSHTRTATKRANRTNHRQEQRTIPPRPYARMRVTSPSVEAIANMEIDAVQKKRVSIAMAPDAPNAIAIISTARTAAANLRFVLLFIFVSTFCVSPRISLAIAVPAPRLAIDTKALISSALHPREHFRLLLGKTFRVCKNFVRSLRLQSLRSTRFVLHLYSLPCIAAN
jgi:hypothetical protein